VKTIVHFPSLRYTFLFSIEPGRPPRLLQVQAGVSAGAAPRSAPPVLFPTKSRRLLVNDEWAFFYFRPAGASR